MQITQTHHIDCSEPDSAGIYDYHYEYDVYTFTDGETSIIARSYEDEPDEASFMSIRIVGNCRTLELSDLCHPLFSAAKEHLESVGKVEFTWFNGKSYESLA